MGHRAFLITFAYALAIPSILWFSATGLAYITRSEGLWSLVFLGASIAGLFTCILPSILVIRQRSKFGLSRIHSFLYIVFASLLSVPLPLYLNSLSWRWHNIFIPAEESFPYAMFALVTSAYIIPPLFLVFTTIVLLILTAPNREERSA